ncbi:MAG: hypothetical protein ACOCSE_03465 [Chitinivibrionales bacterium]
MTILTKKKHIFLVLTAGFMLTAVIALDVDAGGRRFSIRGSGAGKSFTGFPWTLTGGLTVNYYMSNKVSTKFMVAWGKDYAELSVGSLLAPLGLLIKEHSDDTKSRLFGYLLLGLSLIENLSFHLPLGQNTELTPTIGFCRLHGIEAPGRVYDDAEVGGNLGFEVNAYPGKHFTFGGYTEGHLLYAEGIPIGLTAGLHIGFLFYK